MLGKTGRRWLRIIHIVFIASLMGGLISIYVISRIRGLDSTGLFVANYSIYQLFNLVVTFSFYGIVSTGLIYSTFTHWGYTKHWWVIAKWIGTLTIFGLVWVWLGPAIHGMVAISDAGLTAPQDSEPYFEFSRGLGRAIFTMLSIMILLIIITIFRPWGQRGQQYALRRGTILILTGFAVIVSISFALLGYYDLQSYRNMSIRTPDLNEVSDGTYQGTASYAGFDYTIEVRIKGHQIIKVEVLSNRESPYAKYAEGILPRILKYQSPDVDAITGATTTSKLLMKATESALEGAKE